MATPISLDKDSLNAALKYIWSQYRTWAITSQTYKNEVSRWRDRVLVLSISGAIIGTLSQQLIVWNVADGSSWLVRGLGFVSAAALALAAYFTKEIFSPDPESRAVRSRAVAEALKSEAYLLATGAPPYNIALTTEQLFATPENLKESVKNVTPVTITAEQKVQKILSVPMAIEDYVEQRVNDQMGYYARQTTANAKKIASSRWLSLILGAASVVLGIVAARYASVAGWIAVIGTITAAIAARQYAGRYQFLIVSYQAAADRLEGLKARWEIERRTEAGSAADHKLILDVEQSISAENSAWMAEWTKRPSEGVASNSR